MERGMDIEDLQDVAQLRVIVTMRDGHDSNLYGTGSQLCYHIMVCHEPAELVSHMPGAMTQRDTHLLAWPLWHDLSAITSLEVSSHISDNAIQMGGRWRPRVAHCVSGLAQALGHSHG